ncbi:MAG: hypothetical protein AAF682_24225 [Planctomycetota bacterium]
MPADKAAGLLSLLAQLADVEERLLRHALVPGAEPSVPRETELEPLVAALLEDPRHVDEALRRLCSGELQPSGAKARVADGQRDAHDAPGSSPSSSPGPAASSHGHGSHTRLSRLEYAACRALTWAVAGYNDAGGGDNPFLDRPRGRRLLLEVMAALPRVRGGARRYLTASLAETRYRGTGTPILDRTYLDPLLRLRPAFADHEALFFELLGILSETLTPEELRLVGGLPVDPADPTAVARQLQGLFESGAPGLALAVARQAWDNAATGEVHRAVSRTVADHADEPEAVVFLVERIGQTHRWPDLWLSVGRRPAGAHALEEAYAQLYAKAFAAPAAKPDADRTREALLTGMCGVPRARLLEIFAREGSPAVRGQALLTLTASRDYLPRGEDLALAIAGLHEGSVAPGKAVGIAYNVASKSGVGSPIYARVLALLDSLATGDDPHSRDAARERRAHLAARR